VANYEREGRLLDEGRRIAGQMEDAVFAARTFVKRNSSLGAGLIPTYIGTLVDPVFAAAQWNQAVASLTAIEAWVDTEQHDQKLERIRA
jgi:hypothetical protein